MTVVHCSEMGKRWKGIAWKLYSKLLWGTDRKIRENKQSTMQIHDHLELVKIPWFPENYQRIEADILANFVSQNSFLIVFCHYISLEYIYYFSIRLCCKSTVEFGSWHLSPLSTSFIIRKMRKLDEMISNVIKN